MGRRSGCDTTVAIPNGKGGTQQRANNVCGGPNQTSMATRIQTAAKGKPVSSKRTETEGI